MSGESRAFGASGYEMEPFDWDLGIPAGLFDASPFQIRMAVKVLRQAAWDMSGSYACQERGAYAPGKKTIISSPVGIMRELVHGTNRRNRI